MREIDGAFYSWLGRATFFSSVLSTAVYYLTSDGVRYLVRAIAGGGRNLVVGS